MADGTIDMIATDHAPHDPRSKRMERLAGLFGPASDCGRLPEGDGEALTQAANGVVGLETALGLALELVHRSVIGPARMVEMMSLRIARLLREWRRGTLEEGARADITLIDPNMEWTVDPAKFISKSRNRPFAGRRLKGRAIVTIVAGNVVYDRQIGAPDVNAKREAILALADGRIFRGRAFGAIGETVGEVVFNTAMTGYQEVLTDPSYKGQIVCMTYPEIGNVGVNADDAESAGVHVEGFIVKEYRARPSNWRSEMALGEYLEHAGVVGHRGHRYARAGAAHPYARRAGGGDLRASTLDPDALVAQRQGLAGTGRPRSGARRSPAPSRYDWNVGDWELGSGYRRPSTSELRDAPLIVALRLSA